MSQDRTSVSKEVLGSLTSCLMEGNADEERGARKARRRALIVSIVVQILVLATLVMYPLLSHGEHLAYTVFTPLPPYTHFGGNAHDANHDRHTGKTPPPCRICAPTSISPIIVTTDHNTTTTQSGDADVPDIPGAPGGDVIPGTRPATGPERGPVAPQQEGKTHEVRRVSRGHIESAMLLRRVEPVYPALPLQMHREGRVELHAIIATDGSIQALEVVSGDPLFYASALAAVREWRYRPTFLDGQAVEVDTQISVIYTLNR